MESQGTPTPSSQPAHNAEPLSELTREGYKLTEYGRKVIKNKGKVIIEAFRKHEERNENEIDTCDGDIPENGLTCKSKRQWLGIIWLENKLLSASIDGTLFLYDNQSEEVRWSIPTGKPLHVSYDSHEYSSSIVFGGGSRKVYKLTKDSNKKQELRDLGLASEFVKKPYGHVEGDIVPSYSETIIHVNPKTGQRISPSTSEAKTDSHSDEILRIKRTDFELTCYKSETNIVLWYQRIASFDISKVGRDGEEKNDVQNLLTPGMHIYMTWSDVDTALLSELYEVIPIKKGQSDDAAAKKRITNLNLLCNTNLHVHKVCGVDVTDSDFYRVIIEKRGKRLHDIMLSSLDHHTKLKLLRGIVDGLIRLHQLEIFLGNMDISDIFVDEEPSIAKISVISEKTKFLLISSSEGATDDMRADMLALGHIIFFILASAKYDNEDLPEVVTSIDDLQQKLKPIYDCSEAPDLLRKLLVNHQAERQITALQVMNHPLLWDPSRKLEFIQAASDHLQANYKSNKKDNTIAIIPIDDIRGTVCGEDDWKDIIDKKFLDAMENDGERKYNYKSGMYYLLRIIRDLKNHPDKIELQLRSKEDVPQEVLEIFQPGGTESYFFQMFPKLVMEVYILMKKHCDKATKFYTSFYKEGP